MHRDLNSAVEAYRRRITDQKRESDRLRGIVLDLETSSTAGRSVRVSKPLRRARADLERSTAALAATRREYARFRVQQAIGPDPAHVGGDLFDEVLLGMTDGRLTRGQSPGPRDGRLSFDTFRALLLADLSLAQVVENARAEQRSDPTAALPDGQTDTRSILRQWGAMAQSDPYVSGVLQRAAAAMERYAGCLAQFTRGLDSLRINYELKQRKVDHLAFIFAGGQGAIQALNYWDRVEQACAQEARQLLDRFCGLEEAREELRRLSEELNAELQAFMRVFVPRYITYATRQTRERRRTLGLRRIHPARLCGYLLEQVDLTDFLLARGSTMEIAVPRPPDHIKGFRKTKSFQRHKKALQRSAMADASTVDDTMV